MICIGPIGYNVIILRIYDNPLTIGSLMVEINKGATHQRMCANPLLLVAPNTSKNVCQPPFDIVVPNTSMSVC